MNKEDYSKYYIQGSDHYLMPKDVFDELFDEMENWKEEAKELNQKYENAVADYETTMVERNELKKLLEEKNKPQIFIETQDMEERYAEGLYQDYLEEENKKYKDQQKEFIKYLEDEIDICDGFLDTVKSDLQEIPYGVISANKTYITTQIKENETAHKVYKEILQKYRSIIGVSDDNKTTI